MNDEAARLGRPDDFPNRSQTGYRRNGRSAPRLVVELPLEGCARISIRAESREDELRLRFWLRHALERRQSLSAALTAWLADYERRAAA